jgi:diguanylate cyclase (GGDEF)-like protein
MLAANATDLIRIHDAAGRESDVVARLGGDEFAALTYDVDQARADVVLERVRKAIAASNATSALPYHLSVSLGESVLAPGATRPFDELIAEADQRMLEHKRARGAGRADVSATS